MGKENSRTHEEASRRGQQKGCSQSKNLYTGAQCSRLHKGELKELLLAIRVAVDRQPVSMSDLQENEELEPDPVPYDLFLQSCAQLMPSSNKWEAMVRGKYVLQMLHRLSGETASTCFTN